MFGLVVRFELNDDEAAAGFDQLVAQTAPMIEAHEPGTLVYAVHAVEGEPLARVFYELYADKAAFEEHERQPHVRRFLTEREDYLSSLRVEFLTFIDGRGVPVRGE